MRKIICVVHAEINAYANGRKCTSSLVLGDDCDAASLKTVIGIFVLRFLRQVNESVVPLEEVKGFGADLLVDGKYGKVEVVAECLSSCQH